jgi:hypothetical protein
MGWHGPFRDDDGNVAPHIQLAVDVCGRDLHAGKFEALAQGRAEHGVGRCGRGCNGVGIRGEQRSAAYVRYAGLRACGLFLPLVNWLHHALRDARVGAGAASDGMSAVDRRGTPAAATAGEGLVAGRAEMVAVASGAAGV